MIGALGVPLPAAGRRCRSRVWAVRRAGRSLRRRNRSGNRCTRSDPHAGRGWSGLGHRSVDAAVAFVRMRFDRALSASTMQRYRRLGTGLDAAARGPARNADQARWLEQDLLRQLACAFGAPGAHRLGRPGRNRRAASAAALAAVRPPELMSSRARRTRRRLTRRCLRPSRRGAVARWCCCTVSTCSGPRDCPAGSPTRARGCRSSPRLIALVTHRRLAPSATVVRLSTLSPAAPLVAQRPRAPYPNNLS